MWVPFSFIDSENLEQALKSSSASGDRIVATDGGRYDVNLDKRLRYPLYWEEAVSVVRRCTWFCKGDGESKLVPYMEDMAARLEADFLLASRENKWPRRVELSAGEYIMMHNANVMVHFVPNNENENWSGEDSVARPRVVRRGIADIEDEIDDGEPAQIDHLIFVVHGIGPIADLNFRSIVECEDFSPFLWEAYGVFESSPTVPFWTYYFTLAQHTVKTLLTQLAKKSSDCWKSSR